MTNRCLAPAASAFLLTALAALAPAQGNTWVSHGPTDAGMVTDVVIADDSVAYAATPNGVFRSNDGGASWQPSGLAGKGIFRIIAPSGDVVLAMSSPGISTPSRDDGETWAPIGDAGRSSSWRPSIPDSPRPSTPEQPTPAIWKSTDAGANWQRLSTTPAGTAVAVLRIRFTSDLRASPRRRRRTLQALPELGRRSQLGRRVDANDFALCRRGERRSRSRLCRRTGKLLPEYRFRGDLDLLELPGLSPFRALFLPRAPERRLGRSSTNPHRRPGRGVRQQRWRRDVGAREPRLRTPFLSRPLACDASGSLVLAGTNTGSFAARTAATVGRLPARGCSSSAINALARRPARSFDGLGRNGDAGLFRSADAGLSWSLGGGSASSSSSFGALAIDPEHPSTLYAGRINRLSLRRRRR